MSPNKIPSIDLHGCTTDEVVDLLDRFIRKYENQEQIVVIVGKGKGVIKNKVLEYLKMGHYPWDYEKFQGLINEGALVVDLY